MANYTYDVTELSHTAIIWTAINYSKQKMESRSAVWKASNRLNTSRRVT
jgi:hypothetical protein